MFANINNELSGCDSDLFYLLLWVIWKNRNGCVHVLGNVLTITKAKVMCLAWLEDYQAANVRVMADQRGLREDSVCCGCLRRSQW